MFAASSEKIIYKEIFIMNVCTFVGRLTSDVELKTTQNGVSVASFNVAVDRAYKQKGQERQTDFIPCVAWRSTAEFISKYFSKGKSIVVIGSLQTRTYNAQDGSKRYVTEVNTLDIEFAESKKDNTQQAGAIQGTAVDDITIPF
jgi:single-strand DNA-binding protein